MAGEAASMPTALGKHLERGILYDRFHEEQTRSCVSSRASLGAIIKAVEWNFVLSGLGLVGKLVTQACVRSDRGSRIAAPSGQRGEVAATERVN
jgi:hypothetical protein